uniref:NTF2-related export protein n=1 Tax=Ursus americanus TaxID=9643 RepID=A0A452S542_URSAM
MPERNSGRLRFPECSGVAREGRGEGTVGRRPRWVAAAAAAAIVPAPRIDASCLTWEGQQFQGKAAIVEKLSSLPFQKIQHSITAQDHQPTPDSCIISMVVGQLKADEDPIMGFHQMFLLKNINDAWVCTNDMFRLALHNFG